jgi:hypothetical protein
MSWAPNRRECCSDDENCREWPSSRNHLVVWNPIQQSRHLDDAGPSNDPIEQTTTTDQHGITTG